MRRKWIVDNGGCNRPRSITFPSELSWKIQIHRYVRFIFLVSSRSQIYLSGKIGCERRMSLLMRCVFWKYVFACLFFSNNILMTTYRLLNLKFPFGKKILSGYKLQRGVWQIFNIKIQYFVAIIFKHFVFHRHPPPHSVIQIMPVEFGILKHQCLILINRKISQYK